jgi:hypothetical protein
MGEDEGRGPLMTTAINLQEGCRPQFVPRGYFSRVNAVEVSHISHQGDGVWLICAERRKDKAVLCTKLIFFKLDKLQTRTETELCAYVECKVYNAFGRLEQRCLDDDLELLMASRGTFDSAVKMYGAAGLDSPYAFMRPLVDRVLNLFALGYDAELT